MAENIHVVPAELRRVAGRHREVAEYLQTLPAAHAAVRESLESLGPIFAGVAAAGRDLLEQRRICYQEQSGTHADLADGLDAVAELWTRHEREAARRLAGLLDDTP